MSVMISDEVWATVPRRDMNVLQMGHKRSFTILHKEFSVLNFVIEFEITQKYVGLHIYIKGRSKLI